ncbi:LysM peptidoglycan-binding domain-containing protein [Bacillus sp. DNRA2]|uniref:LysM peptidoglycan-binding domain-containing protein n=1 Tax=Bacillus sp. DNRA2 TaxID=2723053 RepID=UPI00145CDF6B|nr:LysM peptidoglycan-binding domain-containing protein [Bacillus sp. DNRA2]NMD71644.1 LysM peptidoglycan-binding domain-containing protein [Bacillus sp. DNRA2]
MPIIFRKTYIYTVRQGDTLYAISRRLNSSVEEILKINHLFPPVTDPGFIHPGNVLLVTTPINSGKVSYIIPFGDNINRISYKFGTFPDLLSGVNRVVNPNLIYPNQQLQVPAFIYEIQVNDTLATISQKFGIPMIAIVTANQGRPGFQPDLIWPGHHLIIPMPTSRNIVVWLPHPGSSIKSGQTIDGQARSFEANVLHQVRDFNGIIVSNERFTTASEGAPAYGNFTSTLPFDHKPTTNLGELWVYTRSANDGSIQDLVRTLVVF